MQKAKLLIAGLVAMFLSLSASATSVYDPLVSAVSFTDVITALFAVAAVLAALAVVLKGTKIVLGFIRR